MRARERRRKALKWGAALAAVVAVAAVFSSLMRSRIDRGEITLSEVTRGDVEVSVTATGKVSPAIEEIINSPITTRIVETYRQGGDSVDVGTPILKLDLQSAETSLGKLADERRIKVLELEKLKMNNQTQLNDLAMKVKVEEMRLGSMEVNLRNERRLDSLGSGTTDKVRQAELEYHTARLELEQLRQQLDNERGVRRADQQLKELELNIATKTLQDMSRTLQDAQIRSPRKGILTFINSQVGAQVAEGSRVAVVSNLSHFKVDAEISDNYADRIVAGNRAVVRVGSKRLGGMVSSVTPLSRNGMISFTVQMDNDSDESLRSGLKADVYVVYSVTDNVPRIAKGSYYQGEGSYELFVLSGSELVRRAVTLGEGNYEFVEVRGGLREGEQVVVSNMNDYRGKKTIKLR